MHVGILMCLQVLIVVHVIDSSALSDAFNLHSSPIQTGTLCSGGGSGVAGPISRCLFVCVWYTHILTQACCHVQATSGSRQEVELAAADSLAGQASRIAVAGKDQPTCIKSNAETEAYEQCTNGPCIPCLACIQLAQQRMSHANCSVVASCCSYATLQCVHLVVLLCVSLFDQCHTGVVSTTLMYTSCAHVLQKLLYKPWCCPIRKTRPLLLPA